MATATNTTKTETTNAGSKSKDGMRIGLGRTGVTRQEEDDNDDFDDEGMITSNQIMALQIK